MGCKWQHASLGDICRLVGGSAFPRRYQGQSEGVPFIKVSDMNLSSNGWMICKASNHVNEKVLVDIGAKKQPRGATVFAKIGEALKADRTRMLTTETAIDNNMMAAIPKSGTDKWFLYYLISWLRLSNYAEGSALPYLKQSTLNKIPITLPNSEVAQRKVVEILYELDSQIKLNTAQNGYLKALASTAYRAFIETLGGNYHEGTMSELLEIRYGKDHKRLTPGNVPVYGSGGLMRKVDSSLYSGESVLIPRKGSLNNVMYVDEAFWTVDTMFYTVPKEPGAAKYCYQFLCNQDLASMNSGSAVPSMTIKILDALPIKVPTNRALETFNDEVAPLYSAVKQFQIENERLSSLRETLLPRLMSGEIDISKIEVPAPPNSHLSELPQEEVGQRSGWGFPSPPSLGVPDGGEGGRGRAWLRPWR
ncbi:restriction endonuclease subunit S [Atopobiaceae bacterium HCP3S3_D6]